MSPDAVRSLMAGDLVRDCTLDAMIVGVIVSRTTTTPDETVVVIVEWEPDSPKLASRFEGPAAAWAPCWLSEVDVQ